MVVYGYMVVLEVILVVLLQDQQVCVRPIL